MLKAHVRFEQLGGLAAHLSCWTTWQEKYELNQAMNCRDRSVSLTPTFKAEVATCCSHLGALLRNSAEILRYVVVALLSQPDRRVNDRDPRRHIICNPDSLHRVPEKSSQLRLDIIP